MSAILFGVPGKLKELLSRVPSNNAAKIANLDAAITSRAPAGTAVSNTVLTPAKIALLNNLDAAITTRQSETNALARYNHLNTDMATLQTAVNARQTEYSASVRHDSMVARTGIKNIFYTSANGYGTGAKVSAVFSGTYTVVRGHTFIVPLDFGGEYAFNWALAANLKTVQFSPSGGASNIFHSGNCIVIEFNG